MREHEHELHPQPLVGLVLGVVEAVEAGEGRGEVKVRKVDVGVAVPGLLGQRGGLGGQPLLL